MATGSMPPNVAALRARFSSRQLARRRYWPLWLGVGLALLALSMSWTATTTYESMRYCRDYEYGCSYYGTKWDSLSWGGFGAGGWSLPLLAVLGSLLAWAAARRDQPLPGWFRRVPRGAVAILLAASAIHLPGAMALSDWFSESQTSGVIQTYDLAGGPFLMALAAWPLWIGARRVARTLDGTATATATAIAPSPAQAPRAVLPPASATATTAAPADTTAAAEAAAPAATTAG